MDIQPVSDRFGLVGATLASRYHVDAVVEETSLSVVYRAEHRAWRRPVAIKAFKLQAVDEASRALLLEAFIREGALLAELSERTAAICQARDVASVTTPGGEWVPYLVLEWLEGEALDTVLARERAQGKAPRSVNAAMRLLAPVGRALAVAHARGIVHRDVKPGNICLLADVCGRSGPTKLLDFGIALTSEETAAAGGMAAVQSFTPSYGAPEQFDAGCGAIGPWTDVFALALVFVELVAGREALAGTNVAQLAVSAWAQSRPTPQALGVDVSDEVEAVLLRALAVRTEDRFPNAAKFWSALSQAVAASRPEFAAPFPIPLVHRRSARAEVTCVRPRAS